MINTKRQSILNSIKATLEDITITGATKVFPAVNLGRIPPTDIETVAFPACWVYSDREMKFFDGENAVIGRETWEWFITLEVWALDKDMETLLNSIHSAMYANYTFDGYAEWSERIGIEFLTFDVERRLEAMFIQYRLVYRHLLGDMEG